MIVMLLSFNKANVLCYRRGELDRQVRTDRRRTVIKRVIPRYWKSCQLVN